nr:cytochrome oxidase subunit 3 [Pseudamphistomum truncatum]UUJ43679.1 cytochrome oxidase subunit 3 [Pseudamphistomum truncatum]UUJ43680.1 cytochrome oxidase subunit 3 [Pseudamphistomum truncatum]UUJ43681.1 cytochrome oxidase subunit 3 [Pseudamphistomum truncatum]
MSWLPFQAAWGVFMGIVNFFYWFVMWPLAFFGLSVFLIVMVAREVVLQRLQRHSSAFWLFISGEIILFASLFAAVVWGEESGVGALADGLEFPFVSCFLLLTSSVTITVYHHCYGLYSGRLFLYLSMVLGFLFIVVQMCEFYGSETDSLYCSYFSASYITVGLHFTHVAVGLLAMLFLLLIGSEEHHYYSSLVVWYWHFVDYVWLWVYLLIYY